MFAREILEPLVALSVRHWVRLERVHHIRELRRVADKEHLQVVPHQVPVALFRVKLHSKPARVAQRLWAVSTMHHGRKPRKDRRLLARVLEKFRPRVLCYRLVADFARRLKIAMRRHTARMHHTLRNPLPVEMRDLFQKMVVLQRRWSAIAHRPQILVVINRVPLPRCQRLIGRR